MRHMALSLLLKIPAAALERSLPISHEAVGEEVAECVRDLSRTEQLGYYPALEYACDRQAIDNDLLSALESIADIACNLACHEIKQGLRSAFSACDIESLQAVAYTLPAIRPKQLNAWINLVQHFTPDTIKVSLRLALRHEPENGDAPEKAAIARLQEALKGRFDRIEVCSAYPL